MSDGPITADHVAGDDLPWRSVLTCAQTSRSRLSSSGRAVISCRRVDAIGFDDCVDAGVDASRIRFPMTRHSIANSISISYLCKTDIFTTLWLEATAISHG